MRDRDHIYTMEMSLWFRYGEWMQVGTGRDQGDGITMTQPSPCHAEARTQRQVWQLPVYDQLICHGSGSPDISESQE